MKYQFDSVLSYSIDTTDDYRVKVVENIMGDVRTRYIDLRNAAIDKAIRDKLIALGWTPPPEAKE